MDNGRAMINPLGYAEASAGYQTAEELDVLLPTSAVAVMLARLTAVT